MVINKSIYIDRLLTFVSICILLSMCVRPTIAQQCGFDLLSQHIPTRPAFTNFDRLDDSTLLVVPVVVHVIHHSADTYGVGSNITDEQVISAIDNVNFRMQNNAYGDTRIRLCLAEIDPWGGETSGITRSDWTPLYDEYGIALTASPLGESDWNLKTTFGWPKSDYYNMYVVSEIDNNEAQGGIQGYAYFPTSSPVDGTVTLYNVTGFDPDASFGYNLKWWSDMNTTVVHEIGHGLDLYHTFHNTTGCSQSDCTTQGDRVCDTAPHFQTSGCVENCPDAPIYNYLSYSPQDCRVEFTPEQVARMRYSLLNDPQRVTLIESEVCGFDEVVVDPNPPLYCDTDCLNDICSDAIQVDCTPIEFCNVNCTTETGLPVLTHPANSNVNCGGTTHYLSQWFTFTLNEFQYVTMNISGVFDSEFNTIGNFGEFEGVQWKLAKGDCGDLEWIAASSCPTWATDCFCLDPIGVEPCADTDCALSFPLTSYFQNLDPVQTPIGNWLPYDPTQQSWNMTFPLDAGTYYILVSAFTPGDGQGGLFPSYGGGTISICPETPLSNKPSLTNSGATLQWAGITATDWAVFMFDGVEWVEIVRTTETTHRVSESGYYIVAGSTGFSNMIFLEIQSIYKPRYRFDVLGRQGAKSWIK